MPTPAPPSWLPGLLPHGRRRLYVGLAGLLLVLVAGTVGYLAFGLSLLDAVFQTVITVSTVGFGEAKPFGPGEKVFTIVLILVGVATAVYTFGIAIDTLVEGYLGGSYRRRRMQRQIGAMRGHMALCGWGRVGRAIGRRGRPGADVVVVDISAGRAASVAGPYVNGDATDEEVLRAAGIDRARVLVTALSTDADNLYVTLTARSMAPGLFIVSRAANDAAVGKLLQAGADRVVNPQDLGAPAWLPWPSSPKWPSSSTWSCTTAAWSSAWNRWRAGRFAAGWPDVAQRPCPRAHRHLGAGDASTGRRVPHQPAAHGGNWRWGHPHRYRRCRPGGVAPRPGIRGPCAKATANPVGLLVEPPHENGAGAGRPERSKAQTPRLAGTGGSRCLDACHAGKLSAQHRLAIPGWLLSTVTARPIDRADEFVCRLAPVAA